MSVKLFRLVGKPRRAEVVFLLSGIAVFASAVVTYGVYCAVCEVPAAVLPFTTS